MHACRLRRDDAGSAVVDAVLVLPLLLLLAVAVLQVMLALHVRSTLVAAAAEGARAAALAGADAGSGVARTRALLDDTVSASIVRSISARAERWGGIDVLAVRIEADLPLIGLLGPSVLTVEGHALREGWT